MLMICRAKALHFMATYAGETLKKNAFYGDHALLRDAGAGHIKSLPQRLIKHFPGIIRGASGGTLFLDEIGETSMELQPKLLRFLETRRARRSSFAH